MITPSQVWLNELMESFSSELSDGATTNRFNHLRFLSCRDNKRVKSLKPDSFENPTKSDLRIGCLPGRYVDLKDSQFKVRKRTERRVVSLIATLWSCETRSRQEILKLAAAFLLTQISFVVGQSEQSERYAGRTITGTAYFMGGRTRVPTRQFRLIVNRYTTQQEVSQLNSALQSGGEDDIYEFFRK